MDLYNSFKQIRTNCCRKTFKSSDVRFNYTYLYFKTSLSEYYWYALIYENKFINKYNWKIKNVSVSGNNKSEIKVRTFARYSSDNIKRGCNIYKQKLKNYKTINYYIENHTARKNNVQKFQRVS